MDGDAGPLSHWHVWDTVIILEDGNLPHPRCPRCDVLVPWRAMNRRNITTSQCAKGAYIKQWRMEEEDIWDSAERAFQAYGRPLEAVTSFKYLGWVLTAADNDWPVIVGNLKKSRKSWAQLTSILVREGANPRVSGMFFKAVLQTVLLFGSETWVLTPAWDSPQEASNAGLRGGSWVDSQREGRRGDGNTHLWRQRWRRQYLRR